MMTPEQTIEEVELFLKNLKIDDFHTHHLVDLLEVLNQAEIVVGRKLLTSDCDCDNKP